MTMKCLVETALLTHGLPSIGEEELRLAWRQPDAELVWLEEGELRRGMLEAYLPLRRRARETERLNAAMLDGAIERRATGALTASATMLACSRMGAPLAVSCGIGGLRLK